MKITIPLRVTLEVKQPEEASKEVIRFMKYMQLFRPDLQYNLGNAMIGEFNPSKEIPFGKPK